jgi:hypothetical protein
MSKLFSSRVWTGIFRVPGCGIRPHVRKAILSRN